MKKRFAQVMFTSIFAIVMFGGISVRDTAAQANSPANQVFGSPPRLEITIPTVNFSDATVTETKDPSGVTRRKVDVPFLAQYFAGIYKYAVAISGVIAIVLMMVGGFQIMIDQRKEGFNRISNALVGLLLTLGTYIILYAISPDLVTFKSLTLEVVKGVPFANCQSFVYDAQCGQRFTVVDKNVNAKEVRERYGIELNAEGNCLGKSCSDKPGGDESWRCDTQKNTCIEKGACAANGASCAGDADCCGNFCVEGQCSNGGPGSICNPLRPDDCLSGICIKDFAGNKLGKCETGQLGSRCNVSSDPTNATGNCAAGFACVPNGGFFAETGDQPGICVKQVFGSVCFAGHAYCSGISYTSANGSRQPTICREALRFDDLKVNFGICGKQVAEDPSVPKVPMPSDTVDISPNEICSADAHCFARGNLGAFCFKDFLGSGTATIFGVCINPKVQIGEVCKTNDNCLSGSCYLGGKTYGQCVGGSLGEPCDTDANCKPAPGQSELRCASFKVCIKK